MARYTPAPPTIDGGELEKVVKRHKDRTYYNQTERAKVLRRRKARIRRKALYGLGLLYPDEAREVYDATPVTEGQHRADRKRLSLETLRERHPDAFAELTASARVEVDAEMADELDAIGGVR